MIALTVAFSWEKFKAYSSADDFMDIFWGYIYKTI
jgi:hypothetical protein